MPEALFIVAVFAVVVAVYIGAKLNAGGSGGFDAQREIQRLRQHELWLQQRLQRAQRENWGEDMIAQCTTELEATSRQLARTAPVPTN